MCCVVGPIIWWFYQHNHVVSWFILLIIVSVRWRVYVYCILYTVYYILCTVYCTVRWINYFVRHTVYLCVPPGQEGWRLKMQTRAGNYKENEFFYACYCYLLKKCYRWPTMFKLVHSLYLHQLSVEIDFWVPWGIVLQRRRTGQSWDHVKVGVTRKNEVFPYLLLRDIWYDRFQSVTLWVIIDFILEPYIQGLTSFIIHQSFFPSHHPFSFPGFLVRSFPGV